MNTPTGIPSAPSTLVRPVSDASPWAVELADVDKMFHTHHFFSRGDDNGRRLFYRKKLVHAVDHVTLGIKPGEVFGMLGPNGAGKTTCVKMISGLVKPDSGKVFVEGMHVEKQRGKVLTRVGVVLEGTRTVIWPLTPLENLAYFGNLRGIRGGLLKKRSRELLEFIGLHDKMDVQVRKLSRGQRQRLAICIALIADPAVILLDEPTTGLDVQSSLAIRAKVRELTRDLGKSVLVTTHDMNVAQEICDRIAIIDKGKLISCKPTAELLEIFSEQTYEFTVAPMPDPAILLDIPGVHNASLSEPEQGDLALVVRVEDDEQKRSAALYAVVQRLESRGCLLLGMKQRQQTLENVFLRLTQG